MTHKKVETKAKQKFSTENMQYYFGYIGVVSQLDLRRVVFLDEFGICKSTGTQTLS
jgi:hypothetical protein